MAFVVLITGAGAGIGRATAYKIGRQGATVVICEKNIQRLTETCVAMRHEGIDVLESPCDVGDWNQVSHTISEVVRRYEKIDALVNNAGVSRANPMGHDVGHEAWRAILATNLDGLYYCTYGGSSTHA